jgi:hypothetical protein
VTSNKGEEERGKQGKETWRGGGGGEGGWGGDAGRHPHFKKLSIMQMKGEGRARNSAFGAAPVNATILFKIMN